MDHNFLGGLEEDVDFALLMNGNLEDIGLDTYDAFPDAPPTRQDKQSIQQQQSPEHSALMSRYTPRQNQEYIPEDHIHRFPEAPGFAARVGSYQAMPEDGHKKVIADKKRQDRNAREQQRSLKISKQIDNLKVLLENSGVPVKNSKFSVLEGVSDYLRELKNRLQEAGDDTEHFDNSGELHASTGSGGDAAIQGDSGHSRPESMEYVDSGVYRSILLNLPTPLALTFMDGTMIACNDSFKYTITGQPLKTGGTPQLADEKAMLSLFGMVPEPQKESLRSVITTLGAQHSALWALNEPFPSSDTPHEKPKLQYAYFPSRYVFEGEPLSLALSVLSQSGKLARGTAHESHDHAGLLLCVALVHKDECL